MVHRRGAYVLEALLNQASQAADSQSNIPRPKNEFGEAAAVLSCGLKLTIATYEKQTAIAPGSFARGVIARLHCLSAAGPGRTQRQPEQGRDSAPA